MKVKKQWLVVLLVFLVSCVTVNIYFPAAAIQKAADRIVGDVRKGTEKKPEQKPKEKPGETGLLERLRSLNLGPTEAYAAGVDLNVSTPAIRALEASMANRFPRLRPLYDKGAIGETNDGLVAVRGRGALSLRERAELNRLVERENSDRKALYSEIMRANNLDASKLPEVQRLFANSWRGKSSPGWWIQEDNGRWVRK